MKQCEQAENSNQSSAVGDCRLSAEVFQQPLPQIREIKIPKFSHVDHADGSATITDSVGLKLEILPGVSERTRNEVEFASLQMPEGLRKSMADAGIPVIVANSMADLNPALKGKALPASDKSDTRKTWDEVGAAFFDDKDWNFIGRTAVVVTPEYLDAMPHEGAHALDDILGRPSLTPAFRALWAADLKNAAEHKIPIRPYLAQPGDRGVEETFAEVYEAVTAPMPNAKDAEVLRTFPSVAEYMRKLLASKSDATSPSQK